MAQTGSARDARRRSPIAVAVTVLLASSGATAAEPKSVDGLLQFANVRVVDAPQSAATAAPQGGMRAYKDSADSELRGPTTEELQDAAAASRLALRRSASGADAAGDNELPTFAVPGGGVGVVLDESSMQYSVVVRQADGSLKEVCVTGPNAAEAVVRMPSVRKTAANREIQNVR